MGIIKRAFLLLLLAGAAHATKIVSQQTGNWGDTAAWVGGVVPGNGDEVSIFHTITTTDTRIVGISASSGTNAIHLNSTGTLNVNGAGFLSVRGLITYTAASASNNTMAVFVSTGGALAFDASVSSSPTTLHYAFIPSGNTGYRKFKVVGSSSSYASVYNTVASTIATLSQNGFSDGGRYELFYASMTRMGFTLAYNNAIGSQVQWNAQHSSFTNCDVININAGGNIYSSGTFVHEYNYHQNSWGTQIFTNNVTSKMDDTGAGVRSIKGNVFDTLMTINSSLGLGDFTIRDNFIGAGYSAGQSSFSLMTNNFIRQTNAIANMGAAGTISNSYIWWDDDQQNAHVFSTSISSEVYISSVIFGMSGRAKATGSDDSGEFWLQGGPGRISTMTITGSIFMLNGAGYQGLQITSLLGDSNPNKYLNNRFVCDHNIYAAGWDNSSSMLPPFGAVQYDESANMAPDTLSSFRDNILWNPMISTRPAQFFKVYDSGNAAANGSVGYQIGPTTDVCNPSHCDYNYSYLRALSTGTAANTFRYLNQGKGYAGNWSTTPGAHDVDAQDPKFVDPQRNVETFDSKYWRPYFGIAQPSAWSSGATYNEGDVVTASSVTYYSGDSINYVYIDTGSCSGANPQPGTIPIRNWNKCWKFQSIEDIKHAIISSTTFTDATLGLTNANVIQTLNAWVRAGYSPQNTAYHATAHDGGDIGAVPWTSAVSTFSHITGAWVTTSEKVARQDLWPQVSCTTCTRTTNWNGNRAYIFGGKGENLHAITYLQNNAGLDATNVNVRISSFTDNAGHFIIPLEVSSTSVWNSHTSGPIQLFYYQYVQINGLTQENYDITEIDERDLPPRLRVPCTITPSGPDAGRCPPDSATQLWTNRPDHDKFYPEIALPYESIRASSFTVAASSSQAIGMDVYIPTSTFIAANSSFTIYYATMSIYEGTTLSTAIPFHLKVYNFTMPTRPRLPVLAAIGPSHISLFHENSSGTVVVGGARQTTREHYYQFMWRHGLIPIGDDDGTILGTNNRDYPTPEYQSQIDGSLFTNANGFGNSPKVSTGVPFYMIGTYVAWYNATFFSSTTITGGTGAFCSNVSSWSVNMGRDYPGCRTALYLYDEPDSAHLVDDVERLASIMQSTCAMTGTTINSFTTESWVDVKSSAPHVNMPATTLWSVFSHLQTDWQIAADHYQTDGTTQAWAYNAHSPTLGTMLDTGETGPAAMSFGLADFKKGVQGHFIWEIVNWDNANNFPEVINDLWNEAKTFGGTVVYGSFSVTGITSISSCPYADNNGNQYNVVGTQFVSGGAGWLVMISTENSYRGFNPASPSGTLDITSPATCTGDATINYSSWTKTLVHPIRGRNGFNRSLGDGVEVWPGTNLQDPAHNYGIDGPIGGFRLKMTRNGINLYDYASMAYASNSSSTTAIINTVIPTVLYELEPVLNHGYYHTGRQWSDDPQVWESNRELLANWIAASTWSTITSNLTASGTTGFSFNYQATATQNAQGFTATGLPTGLTMDSSGLISGIPTVYGSYNVTLTANNALGTGPSATLVITLSRVGLPFKTRFR